MNRPNSEPLNQVGVRQPKNAMMQPVYCTALLLETEPQPPNWVQKHCM